MTNGVTMVRRAVLALILLLLADPAWSQNIDGQAGGGNAQIIHGRCSPALIGHGVRGHSARTVARDGVLRAR